jgi:hypothetical protein
MATTTRHAALDRILAQTRARWPDDTCSIAAIARCDQRLLDYLDTGIRVRVWNRQWNWTRTGLVGRTGGRLPCLMLLKRSNSTGSSDLLGPDDVLVAVKRGQRYEEAQ